MEPETHDGGFEGGVEILDRVSGCWISLSNFREVVQHTRAILVEYSYGYQERFVASGDIGNIILEPFYSSVFILGCVENGPSLLSTDIFLTGGDEEEFWLIESDSKEVSLSLVTDAVVQTDLMEAIGGALGFQRIERGMLKGMPATVLTQLLRLETARWKQLVESWARQYISLLDVLLEVKKDDEAQLLLRDRGRLLRATRGALPSRMS